MYTENGITYVEGIEDVFMGYFLTYHSDKYKYKINTRIPTDADRQRVKKLESIFNEERRVKQLLKKLDELQIKEEAKLKAKEEAKLKSILKIRVRKQKYYQDNKEYFRIKSHERYVREMKEKYGDDYSPKKMKLQNIPYSSDTKEYKHEYYIRNKERIKNKRKEKYRQCGK